MAKTGGGAGSQEQGTLVTDLIKAPWWPGMNNPIVPEAPIPTAPSLFEQLAARRGVDVGSEYSRATEQVEASQTIVQVYVDGSEVTSRFNERIIDSTKNMGAF